MNATAVAATRSNSRLSINFALSALALLALWFIGRSALPYLEFSQAHYGPYFWPRRWGLVLHIAGGITARVDEAKDKAISFIRKFSIC